MRIHSVKLSPLTVEIRYGLEDVRKLEETVYAGQEDTFLQELFVTGFVDGSGKEIPCGLSSSGGHYDYDSGENILVIGLSTAVDAENITAVLLGKDTLI